MLGLLLLFALSVSDPPSLDDELDRDDEVDEELALSPVLSPGAAPASP